MVAARSGTRPCRPPGAHRPRARQPRAHQPPRQRAGLARRPWAGGHRFRRAFDQRKTALLAAGEFLHAPGADLARSPSAACTRLVDHHLTARGLAVPQPTCARESRRPGCRRSGSQGRLPGSAAPRRLRPRPSPPASPVLGRAPQRPRTVASSVHSQSAGGRPFGRAAEDDSRRQARRQVVVEPAGHRVSREADDVPA